MDSVLFNIIFFTFLATILSLFLVSLLLLHKKLIHSVAIYLVSFAAGALLATGFLDTFPEAVKETPQAFLWVTLSFTLFFFIERLFLSVHHHEDEDNKESLRIPTSFLIFGDGLHNFIDGVSIAGSFLVSRELGIITALAVFVHEIPHELGDFGILLHKGWGRSKVLWFNIATGAVALLGALLAYYVGSKLEHITPILLSLTTGNFIYLSATDLLPEIHHRVQKKEAFVHALLFLLGILLIVVLMKVVKE